MSKRRSGITGGSPQTQQRTIRGAVLVAAVLVAAGGVLYAANLRGRELYDLSVVGSGVPVVVQVHDISCPVCNELRENVKSVAREFGEEELQLKVADVASDEGLDFAAQYTEQRRVTLLYFDAAGRLTDVQSGIQSQEELRRAFREHIRQNG